MKKLNLVLLFGMFLNLHLVFGAPLSYYNSSFNSSYNDSNGSRLKFSFTAFQLFSLENAARPLSVSGFIGSQMVDFGDIGLYVQSTFPAGDLGSITHAGLQIAPKLLEKTWGGMLWSNKIGYGNYKAQSALIVGTGLIFETGRLLHVYADFIHNIPISKDQDLYSNTFGLGFGLRLLE